MFYITFTCIASTAITGFLVLGYSGIASDPLGIAWTGWLPNYWNGIILFPWQSGSSIGGG